ncbi:UDP-glucose 4-epimerase family protein [Rhodocyclus tenuis]|uniref:UDP-glucose 4-epimerase n=1 Tax=Rhodocyclus tenuis TaxID=1066 RepID=A0A840G4P0_RHOTE|nr:SDR family oxidoreductase [Rhodocyclus tenuis]MBB4246301.1 UDP-glucose 4-epimerase [Rhodocyclus tenuis]
MQHVRRSVFLTGASGFVGGALARRLASTGCPRLNLAVRSVSDGFPAGATGFLFDQLDAHTDWTAGLSAAEVVIHAAARVHVMNDAAQDPLAEFRRVNVEGTLNLARQAAASGVRRFVFLSSVKVNGEHTLPGCAFSAADAPVAIDPYGISKQEAERGLRALAAESGMEVVIIRPPLVYGPGVKANFLSMMHWLKRGVPLPLGAIDNRRSLVGIDNLVDLIVTCIDHPAAANQTFMVSDGEDLSTSDLLRRLSAALGRPARLLPVPPWLLRAGAALLGKPELARRLCGNMQVDITKTRELLGWSPPLSVDEGLRRTAVAYLAGLGAH